MPGKDKTGPTGKGPKKVNQGIPKNDGKGQGQGKGKGQGQGKGQGRAGRNG